MKFCKVVEVGFREWMLHILETWKYDTHVIRM